MYTPRNLQPNVRFPVPQHGYNQQSYNPVHGSHDYLHRTSMSPFSPNSSWIDRRGNTLPYGENSAQGTQNHQMYQQHRQPNNGMDFSKRPTSMLPDPNTVTLGKKCNCGALPPKSYCPCTVRIHGAIGLQKTVSTQTESSLICSYAKADFFKPGTEAFNHLSDVVRSKRDQLAARNTWTKIDIQNAAFEVRKKEFSNQMESHFGHQ